MTVQEEEIREFRVPNEGRELRFSGQLLAFSSTEDRGSDRWIEFVLYKTLPSGKYILSRTGRSVRFHDASCRTVSKNPGLRPVPLASLAEDTSPCPECLPYGDDGLDDNHLVYPEQDRRWAGVYDTPEALIDGLSRNDSHGVRSLTMPAKVLLERASTSDPVLSRAYYVVRVD